MRIVIVGQQAFGKAVLDAFLARGDTVAGVFAAPERPGARLTQNRTTRDNGPRWTSGSWSIRATRRWISWVRGKF